MSTCSEFLDVPDDPRLRAFGLLLEASAALVGTLGRDLEHELELPLAHFEVLLRLARSPDQRRRMAELAADVALSASGLTRLIDRLEARGLVVREACEADRRGAFAVLTPAGTEVLAAAVPVHLAGLERHLRALDAPELDLLAGLLQRLRDDARAGAAATA